MPYSFFKLQTRPSIFVLIAIFLSRKNRGFYPFYFPRENKSAAAVNM